MSRKIINKNALVMIIIYLWRHIECITNSIYSVESIHKESKVKIANVILIILFANNSLPSIGNM